MKLYKHVSRFEFLRMVPKYLRKKLPWALGLKPGDMINDCSGFNVVIRKVEPELFFTNRGWFIYDIHFVTEPFGGYCSLRHCGVIPPLSVQDIEREMRKFYDDYEGGGGWRLKTDKDPIWVNLSGDKSICDELGRSIFRSKT